MGSMIPKEIKYNLHYDEVWGMLWKDSIIFTLNILAP